MYRYACIVEYEGSDFSGWQFQPDQKTVQSTIEAAITRFCSEKVSVTASGRTDAGVHARGQVVHMDFHTEHSPETVMGALNFHLRPDLISVIKAVRVSDEFHARFSAVMRHYEYKIINRQAPVVLDKQRAWHVSAQLDDEAMKQAASYLLGKHDFSSFRDGECQAKSPIRTLDRIAITRDSENMLIEVSARSFLHHMVRNIVGTLYDVGRGKRSASDIPDILAEKNRVAAGPTAPACGLYFMRVDYPDTIGGL